MDKKEKIIEDLIKVIETAPDKFSSGLNAIEKRMLDELLLLVKELQVKNGRIVPNAANLKIISSIRIKLEKLVLNKQYVKDLSEFIKSFSSAAIYAQAYYKSISEDFKPKPYYTDIGKAAISNTIDALTEVGIRANVLNPTRSMLLTAVTSGQSYASLIEALQTTIAGKEDKQGLLSRYANTYARTAIAQFNRQYMAAIRKDLGYKWFSYRGSNLTTTREFCEHMIKKRYIHESEFETVLAGNIDGHQCKIYEKTGLPYGLIEGTNATNFEVYLGGWNCQHGLYGEPDYMVPQEIRDKLEDSILSGQTSIPFTEYKGEFVEIDKNGAIEKLDKISDHEEAYSFLADGTVYHKIGGKNKVSFNNHELKLLKNADLLHNHPGNDQPSLSKEDIQFALKHGLKSISSINNGVKYTFENSNLDLPKWLNDSNYNSYNDFYKEVVDDVYKEMFVKDSKTYDVFLRNMDHHFNKEIAKRLKLKYSASSYASK